MHEDRNLPEKSGLTILLVEEDDDTRPNLTRRLRALGYRLLVPAELADAREWVSGDGYLHADLVLINLLGKTPEEALKVGRELRDHAKYDGHTPLIVVAEKYGADLEGTDVNVSGNDWIIYTEDAQQLQNLLASLLNKL